ncbi:hypothetical protein [Fluviicola sp.]|jgi:hypothetical protein|uniref:hypothetical protein n=1 Tax=Fluviicola sp. TaxID=1917219 RepID=UPI00281C6AD3|nr:hypothetical protein [Fluviicola sp.]MDR0801684.1 hypothetical protein [Fluviicola sp.]
MKIKNILFFCCLLLVFWTEAQETGYYGRRVFLEIDGQGQIPLLQNIFGERKGYVSGKGSLHSSYNLLDIAYRASLNMAITESVGFGLEFSQRFYRVNLQSIDELTRNFQDTGGNMITQYLNARVAYLPIRETVFMPRILVALDDSRIPCGFASEIGVGYSLIQFPDRDLTVETVNPGESSVLPAIKKHLLDPRAEEFNGMVFMYGFRMNYPLTKRILFHIGFRYQYALQFGKKKFRRMDESEYWFSAREIWSKVNLRRQLGIFSFGTGLTFTL